MLPSWAESNYYSRNGIQVMSVHFNIDELEFMF